MILSQMKSAKNSIVFIERNYRKKDPKYADFSIRQQREILRRLREEWNRTECQEPPPDPRRKQKRNRGMGKQRIHTTRILGKWGDRRKAGKFQITDSKS